MKKMPKMLTAKDLDYIKDMFNWHLITYQKITYYEKDLTNKKAKQLLTDIAEQHYAFCQKLITILESGENK